MYSIKVIKKENKYILKTLDKLREVLIDAHLTGKLDLQQVDNITEFIEEHIIQYQHIKQENILFKITSTYEIHDSSELRNKIIQLHRISDQYFDELCKGQMYYEEGRYLSIYNIINNGMTYITLKEKLIDLEEEFYKYIERTLNKETKKKIDMEIAGFNKRLEKWHNKGSYEGFNLTTI